MGQKSGLFALGLNWQTLLERDQVKAIPVSKKFILKRTNKKAQLVCCWTALYIVIDFHSRINGLAAVKLIRSGTMRVLNVLVYLLVPITIILYEKKKLYVLVRKTISSLAKNKLASPNDAPEGSKNSLSFSICCRFAFLCPFLVLGRNSHSSRFISSCRCSNPMHHWVLFSHVCYCSFPCRLFNELSFQLVLVFKPLVVCSVLFFSSLLIYLILPCTI